MCVQKSAWALENIRNRELASNLYYQHTGEFKAVEATKPAQIRGRRMIKKKKKDSNFFYTKHLSTKENGLWFSSRQESAYVNK